MSQFLASGNKSIGEKEMATHSSVLAWRIPGMGEPGGLPSMGSWWVAVYGVAQSRTQLKRLSSSSSSKSIGVSASASVLPMNIQDLFPLGLADWTSLQSKGLSRVFSNTTVQKHQFLSTQLSL